MAAKKQEVRDWDNYKVYRDDSIPWREGRDKAEKFYFNDQWSQEMGGKLEARGQSDIVINKIRALLRMRVSMMIANKPTGKVFGVHRGDIENAVLLEEFADWHLYNSDWQFHLERVVMAQNRVGVGWLTVFQDPIADYGRGELKVGSESYRHVFLDKASGQKWDFGDAPRIINTKQRRPEDWHMSLPQKIRNTIREGDIEGLLVPDDEIRWSGESQHREIKEVGVPVNVTSTDESKDKGEWIREIDVYERVLVDVPVLFDASGIPLAAGDPDKTDGGFSPELLEQLDEKVLQQREIPMPRIKYHKSISGKLLMPLDGNDLKKKSDILPIENYPMTPVVDEDTGNSQPLGEIDFQAGIQEVFNAAISLTLLNASLASNLKLLVDAQKAGETDLEKLQQQWAVPGAMINMKTDPVTGKFPVEIVRPEPLTQAWFTMAQALAQEIEFQVSTFSLRTGDPTDAPATFAATLQLGQWAQDILRIPLSRLELALERMYNNIFQWSPTYYDFQKMFFTFGADGVPLRRTIDFTTLESVKARYRIRAGSTMPSQTVSELGIMQNLAQINPALIGAVIDRMPGLKDRDKQEVKQTIDIVSQLQQQNAQQEETMGVLQQQLQHLQEQNIALQKDQALDPLKREVDLVATLIRQGRKDMEKLNNKAKKSER